MSNSKATDAYAEMRTRRHWKREDAARALAEWAESGESLTAFARRHELGVHRLQWWRAQLAQQTAAECESVRLVPVVPRQAPLENRRRWSRSLSPPTPVLPGVVSTSYT